MKAKSSKCAHKRRKSGRHSAGVSTITASDIARKWIDQNGRCYWSGMEFVLDPNSLYYPTLDRLDCNIGYTIENTAISCKWANFARGAASVEASRELFQRINTPPSQKI
jgi:hypothetical protein